MTWFDDKELHITGFHLSGHTRFEKAQKKDDGTKQKYCEECGEKILARAQSNKRFCGECIQIHEYERQKRYVAKKRHSTY